MPGAFDVAVLPPRERPEAVYAILAASKTARVEVSHNVAPERIAGTGCYAKVGGLTVYSAQATPLVISRTPRLARDDFEPSLVLGIPRSGSSLVGQDGREVVVRAGDMTLADTTRPYTSVNDAGVDHHYIYLPRSRLALPDRVLRSVTATRFAHEDPVARLVWTFFRALADQGVPLESVPGAAVMDNPGVELVRGLICHQAGHASAGRESAENSLALRVMSYAREHLSDPDLSAANIARAHHVSVRHLYAVLAKADITLGEWIRSRRLDACRAELARPEAKWVTIAAVARRWGFYDATHFGRAFKNAYDMTPGEWRKLNCGS